MAFQLSQVLILLAAVTATFQRRLSSDTDTSVFNDNDGLRNILAHLKTHASNRPKTKPYLLVGKERQDPFNLLNAETLNLILQAKRNQRPKLESVDTGSRVKGNEVQQILDELENELDRNPLRCAERCSRTGRCGCRGVYRTNDRDDDETQLRCKYGRCGKHINDNLDNREDDDQSQLRCKYGRCGKETNLARLGAQLEHYGKKYKISDDLDAIVVDISDLKGLLGQLKGKMKTRSQTQGVDMDYLYGDEERAGSRDDYKDLDAVVLDVNKEKDNDADDDDVVRRLVSELLFKTKLSSAQEENPIRPNELADFFEAKKRNVVNNALNFVQNSRGDKDLSKLSTEQKYQLQVLRAEVQRLGARTDSKLLERKVLDIILGDGMKSEVLPHDKNNNNVYIPRWVYDALRNTRRDSKNKQMFPLTHKQKTKFNKASAQKSSFARRNVRSVNEIGVPFQLQVQGLGQINP